MFPVLLKTPWFTLQSYGVFLALAYLIAIELGIRKAEGAGEDPRVISNMVLVIVIFAFLGGRLLYVWLEWPRFAPHPWKVFYLWEGGLVFFGGLVGAFAACAAYIFKSGLRPWHIADYSMGSVAIGQAIGRVGCLSVGCCYGAAWDGPWAIHLHDAWRHPVQAYASLSLFLLFGLCELAYRRWHTRRPGIVLLVYGYYQGVHRYVMETFRVDPRGGTFHFGLTISQEIAVGILLGTLALNVFLYKVIWKRSADDEGDEERDPEEDEATQFRVAPTAADLEKALQGKDK